jgi:hypothetical protein
MRYDSRNIDAARSALFVSLRAVDKQQIQTLKKVDPVIPQFFLSKTTSALLFRTASYFQLRFLESELNIPAVCVISPAVRTYASFNERVITVKKHPRYEI